MQLCVKEKVYMSNTNKYSKLFSAHPIMTLNETKQPL